MGFIESLKSKLTTRKATDRQAYLTLLERAAAGGLGDDEENKLLELSQRLNRSPDQLANDAAVMSEAAALKLAASALPAAEIEAKKFGDTLAEFQNETTRLLKEHDEGREKLERERRAGWDKAYGKGEPSRHKVSAGRNAVRRLAELATIAPHLFGVDGEQAKKQLATIKLNEARERGRQYQPGHDEPVQPPAGWVDDGGDDIAVDVSPDDVWREKEIANANRAASAEIAKANPLTKTRQTQEFLHS